jgi:hypothetical protein
MREVEFLSTADEPPEPPTRSRRPLWMLVAAACVVAAGVWVLTRPGGDGAGKPRPGPPVPIARPVPSLRGEQPCHGAPFCQTSVAVPRSVIRAVAAHLPAPYTVQVQSHVAQSLATGGTYLADRAVDINGPRLRVLIVVHRRYAVSSASPIAPVPAGSRATLVHLTTAAYDVDLQCIAAPGAAPPRARLRALAGDDRLETP